MAQNVNPLILSIINKVNAHAKPAEIVLGVLALILVLLTIIGCQVADIFLFLILLPLSTLYFLGSYKESEGTNPYNNFLTKLGEFGSSVTVVGILFHLTQIKGDDKIILAGSLTLLSTLVLSLVMRIKQIPVLYLTPLRIIRTVVLVLLAGWMLLPWFKII